MALRLAQWSFLLLVFSLPFVRPFSFLLAGLSIPATDVIFVASAVFAAIAILRGEMRPRFDRAYLSVLVYAAVLTITAFFPEASVVKLLGEYYLFGLCYLTFLHCGEGDFFRKVVITWVAAATVTGMISLLGIGLFYAGWTTPAWNYFLSGTGSLPPGNYPRVQSLFANPNMLCNYLNISIPLVWLAARKASIGKRIAFAVTMVCLVASAFTLSPGLGGIALSLGLLAFAFGSKNKVRIAALASGVLAATVVLAVTLVSPDTENTDQQIRIPFIQRTLEPSVRVLAWQNVLERVSPFPLLGRGVGARPAEMRYQTLSGERQLLTDAHNMYLDVLGQAGILGLAAFLLLIVVVMRRAWRTDTAVVFAAAFAGTVIYQGITGSYEDARHVWVLIGMLIAASGSTAAGNDISPASTAPSPRPSN